MNVFFIFWLVSIGFLQGSVLSCKEAVYDAGVFEVGDDGKMIKYCFKVKNTSDVLVRISEITISCSCTKVDSPGIVGPGETIDVVAFMRIEKSDYNGRLSTMIIQDDSGGKPLVLSLKANSKPMAYAAPRSIQLRQIGSDLTQARQYAYIYYPSEKEHSNFVKEVVIDKPDLFSAKVLWQRRKATDKGFLFYSMLEVNALGRQSSHDLSTPFKIHVKTVDGGDVKIDGIFEVLVPKLIEPEVYFVFDSIASGDFIYDESQGVPERFEFENRNIELMEVVKFGGKHICKFKVGAHAGKVLGLFIVTTKEGKKFTSKIERL